MTVLHISRTWPLDSRRLICFWNLGMYEQYETVTLFLCVIFSSSAWLKDLLLNAACAISARHEICLVQCRCNEWESFEISLLHIWNQSLQLSGEPFAVSRLTECNTIVPRHSEIPSRLSKWVQALRRVRRASSQPGLIDSTSSDGFRRLMLPTASEEAALKEMTARSFCNR